MCPKGNLTTQKTHLLGTTSAAATGVIVTGVPTACRLLTATAATSVNVVSMRQQSTGGVPMVMKQKTLRTNRGDCLLGWNDLDWAWCWDRRPFGILQHNTISYVWLMQCDAERLKHCERAGCRTSSASDRERYLGYSSCVALSSFSLRPKKGDCSFTRNVYILLFVERAESIAVHLLASSQHGYKLSGDDVIPRRLNRT